MRVLNLLGLLAALSGGFTTVAYGQTAPSPAELIYTPVTPCRAFDVNVSGDTAKSLLLSGAGFDAQKGPAAGCGVPASATAVSVNLTVFNPTVAGYLILYPATPRPRINAKYYQSGATFSTDTIVQLGGRSTALYSYKTARVVGDVTGYYAPQIRALINADGTIASATARIVSVAHTGPGSYLITVDRPARECSPNAATYNFGHYASVGLSNTSTPQILSVYTWQLNADGGAVVSDYSFFFSAICQ